MNQNFLLFTGGNVPISMVAKVMKKDKHFIRVGIQEKWLPIGVAYKKEGLNEFSYYVSPKKLYEYTEYVYSEWFVKCTFLKIVHFPFIRYFYMMLSKGVGIDEITKWFWQYK